MIEFRGSKRTKVFKQAAALPFRYDGGRLQFLLITSQRAKRWIIPKGLMEDGYTPPELAAKESYEEAGIVGNICPDSIGEFHYEKWDGLCRVQVFALEVTEQLNTWPEEHFRFRQWFDAAKVPGLLDNEELIILIKRFIRIRLDSTL